MTVLEQNETYTKLCEVISDALQRPTEQMAPNKTLFVDFKMESVEALELEFAIEEAFDITIESDELWKVPSYIATQGMVEEGAFNPQAHAHIQQCFPLWNKETIQAMRVATDLFKAIRIADVTAFIERKLQS